MTITIEIPPEQAIPLALALKQTLYATRREDETTQTALRAAIAAIEAATDDLPF